MWIADTDRAQVLCFAFSPDGSTLYTGDDEGAVFAWDRASQVRRELFRVPRALHGAVSVWQVAPTPCGTRLLVPANSRVYVLDTTGTVKPRDLKVGVTDRGVRVGLSPDGRRFLAPTKLNVAACWDPDTGARVTLPGPLGKYNTCVWAVYLPGGVTVLTMGWDGSSLILWDAATGKRLGECVPERTGSISEALSPDGSRFAVVGPSTATNFNSRQVWVFDLAARERRALIKVGEKPQSVAFHPSGNLLSTADGTRSVKTWNAATGEKVGTFQPKIGDVSSVAYSPDGTIWCAGGVGRFAVFDVDE
jgi:DNA-binding beta-propeller fold protein YncE